MKQLLLITMIAISTAVLGQSKNSKEPKVDTVTSGTREIKYIISLNTGQARLLVDVLNNVKLNGIDKNMMMQYLSLVQTISNQLAEEEKKELKTKPK